MIIDRPPFLVLNIQNVPTAIVQAEPHSQVPASLPDDEAVLGLNPLEKTRNEKAPEPEPA